MSAYERYLLIDDCRDMVSVDAIARTSTVAKEMLKAIEWQVVIFDHDLAEQVTGYMTFWSGLGKIIVFLGRSN